MMTVETGLDNAQNKNFTKTELFQFRKEHLLMAINHSLASLERHHRHNWQIRLLFATFTAAFLGLCTSNETFRQVHINFWQQLFVTTIFFGFFYTYDCHVSDLIDSVDENRKRISHFLDELPKYSSNDLTQISLLQNIREEVQKLSFWKRSWRKLTQPLKKKYDFFVFYGLLLLMWLSGWQIKGSEHFVPNVSEELALADFFGRLSPFEIIVSAIALLTTAYTVYKNFLERAKITAYPGDAVSVVAARDNVLRLNVACNLSNEGAKTGVVHLLEIVLIGPDNTKYICRWNQFYKYAEGGNEVVKESDPHPVTVGPKDSKLVSVQFERQDELSSGAFSWVSGKYEFQLVGWVNRENRKSHHNLKSGKFHFLVDADFVDRFKRARMTTPEGSKPTYFRVPIEEWHPIMNK